MTEPNQDPIDDNTPPPPCEPEAINKDIPACTNPKEGSCQVLPIDNMEFHIFFDGTWNSRYNSDWYNQTQKTQIPHRDSEGNVTMVETTADNVTLQKKLLKKEYNENETSFSREPSVVDKMGRAFASKDNNICAIYVDGSGTVTPKSIKKSIKRMDTYNRNQFYGTAQKTGSEKPDKIFQQIETPRGEYSTVYVPEKFDEIEFKGDSIIGGAFAQRSTGVKAKLNQALIKLKYKIEQYRAEKSITKLKIIRVNVYGFSRGSATARMFINCLLEARNKDFQFDYPSLKYLAHYHFVLDFIGLFDTVSSIGFDHLNDIDRSKQKLFNEKQKPNKVVHIVARHEFRQKYGVTNIRSAVEAGFGIEFALPGCHTDIGDGLDTEGTLFYDDKQEKAVWEVQHKDLPKTICQKYDSVFIATAIHRLRYIIPPLYLAQVMRDEERALHQLQKANFEQIRLFLIEQGWFTADEIYLDAKVFNPQQIKLQNMFMDKIKVHKQYSKDPTSNRVKEISKHYPKIPLSIMFDYVRDCLKCNRFPNASKYDLNAVDQSDYLHQIYAEFKKQLPIVTDPQRDVHHRYIRKESKLNNGIAFNDLSLPLIDLPLPDPLRQILYHDYLHWCSDMNRKGDLILPIDVPHIDPENNHFYRIVVDG